MSGVKLKSFVDRVKALIEQQRELGADITLVCKEAKEADPDLEPAMIRFAARELLMDSDKRNERDDKRARYLHAVGLAVDMVSNGEVSLRAAAKACGVSKSSIHRALAVPAVSQPKRITPCWSLANGIVVAEAEEAERKRAARQAELERKAREREEARLENARIDADPLTIPPFLKGSAGNGRAA